MHRGFVKLWRKSNDTEIMKNHKLWTFWCWCLIKASYKEHSIIVGNTEVILEPGQFIFGRNKASDELGLSQQNIRTFLKTLQKHEKVTIKSTNKFSIISVTNWGTYQDKENQINQQTNKRLTNDQQTTNHKQERLRELKADKEKNNSNSNLKKYLSQKVSQSTIPGIKEKVLSEKIMEFFDYRMSKPKKQQYVTEKGIDGLFRDIGDCSKEGLNLVDCLDICMESNWQSPKVKYFLNQKGNGGLNVSKPAIDYFNKNSQGRAT